MLSLLRVEDLCELVVVNPDVRHPACPEVTILKVKIGASIWNSDAGRVSRVKVNWLYSWTRPEHIVNWRNPAVTATLTEHIRIVIELNLMDLVDRILLGLDEFGLRRLVPSQNLSDIEPVTS